MSEEQEPRDVTSQAASAPEKTANPPSHVAYSVRENGKGDSYFNRVGAAFPHKDGQGFNIDLEAFPTNGKVVLRTPRQRLEEQRAPNSQTEREDPDQSR
ncbi:MAG: hypothetical protein AAFX09_08185 [Pseudomonadota bacterium]